MDPRGPLASTTVVAAIALLIGACGSSGDSTRAANSSPAETSSAPPTRSETSSVPQTPTTPASVKRGARRPGGGPPDTGGAAAGVPNSSPGTGTGLAGATAVLSRHGFTVADPADYQPSQTLRVLVGVRRGSADARVQRAFFFVHDRFLGTDTGDTSASIAVTGQDDTSVTLRYGLYRSADPLCCPSSTASVRYTLDNGRLAPVGPIPSAAARNGG